MAPDPDHMAVDPDEVDADDAHVERLRRGEDGDGKLGRLLAGWRDDVQRLEET